MEDNDDDYFSDDFDALPPGTLYELEQHAFQATQAPTTQHDAQPVQNERTVQNQATLKPPPRLHTGLTNEYDTLEVGELEAEVHDNAVMTSALPPGHHVMAEDSGWTINGGMEDPMDVDDESGQLHAYSEVHARLEQVGFSLLGFEDRNRLG